MSVPNYTQEMMRNKSKEFIASPQHTDKTMRLQSNLFALVKVIFRNVSCHLWFSVVKEKKESDLVVVRLQALYHTRDAKLIVPLGAVQCPKKHK